MDADRGFLYGVVALQAGIIDSRQLGEFIEACREWCEQRDGPMADLLVARGWIQPADREHLDYLVSRKLHQHDDNARASLTSLAREAERSLTLLDGDRAPDSPTTRRGDGNSSLLAPENECSADSANRYALNHLHATGGIGRVWLAHDAQMGRDVALKELRPEQAGNATLRARFLREAQITGQLEHPGIVPVYELARHSGTGHPFYTMRFVKGRTLCDAAKDFHNKRASGKTDSIEFTSLLNAFVVVCKTIAYAHSRGVIHRDLKGQNVIVGGFGEVVVLDWGVAKRVGQIEGESPPQKVMPQGDTTVDMHLTMQGDAIGTPAYMAPEQAAGRVGMIDRRTDVYGLGAMLYQLLTGEPPFAGACLGEILRKVESEEPPPPRQFWAEVPPMLESACLRAMSKQPLKRFASAADLAQEVERWQEVQRQEAIEALRASEALYHSLVESIPIYVWRKDVDGRFTFANKWFCESFGITADALRGKTDFDLFPVELAEKYRRDDARIIETGQTLRLTEEHHSPTSARLVVEVIKIPIRDARGQIIGTQGIFWDVTSWSQTGERSGHIQPPPPLPPGL